MTDEEFPSMSSEEVVLDKLFAFFFKNVALGQWQLAKACLQKIVERKFDARYDLKKCLLDIVDNPLNYKYF